MTASSLHLCGPGITRSTSAVPMVYVRIVSYIIHYILNQDSLAGILHMLLLCPVDLFLPFIGEILGTIEWLLECQDVEGNWPTQAPGKNHVLGRSSNEAVQYVFIHTIQ